MNSEANNVIEFPLQKHSDSSIAQHSKPKTSGIQSLAIKRVHSEVKETDKKTGDRSDSKVNASFDRAKPYYSLGKAFAKKGEWEQAISSYRQALDIDFHSAEINQSLGDALVKNGELDEAVTVYQKAVEIQPNLWEVHHNLADIWQGQGRLDEAVAAYRLAIELNPDFCWSHNNLGDVLIKLEKWEEAAVAYQRAIELNPDFHWSHYNLGDVLAKLEKWEGAVVAYRCAIQLQYDLPKVHVKLAEALQNQIQLYSEEAISLYRREIELNPDNVAIYHKALQIRPSDSQLSLHLGTTLLKQNRIEEAINYYKNAFNFSAEHEDNLAMVLKIFDRVIQVKPKTPEIYLHLGNSFLQQNNVDRAIIFYQIALQIQPNYAETFFQLGNALTQQNYFEKAVICYRKAIKFNPDYCWYYNALGDILSSMGETEEAIAVYRRAIELNPDCQGLYDNLERALNQHSRFNKVKNYCQQFLANQQNKVRDGEPALKILMLTAYPPHPPKSGAPIRMFEQIKYLGKKHHLVVVSFIFSEEDYVIEDALADYCDRAIMVMLGSPLSPRQPHQPRHVYHWDTWSMRKILNQLKVINFDVVMFDFIYMASYREIFKDSYTILQEHNIESQILKRCADINQHTSDIEKIADRVDAVKAFLDAEKEAKLLEQYENKNWSKFNLVTLVSETDRQEVEKRCPSSRTLVVENGVNTRTIPAIDNHNGRKILFMGGLAYYPNIDGIYYFVEEILPKVWEQDPTMVFVSLGAIQGWIYKS
ncbi:MAG: tetratricopeptide repeat protein [Microcoleus sp. SM1_3_4]|nr:tetratricopeptide repeat protein [Microcoleus sp. SM1_3_4]